MNITEILAKIAKGEELTAEEKTFCSVYQEPKKEPSKGSDDSKVKELEEKLAAEQAEKAELAAKVKEAEEAKLSEKELLQKQLDEEKAKNGELNTKFNTLQGNFDKQKFEINISKLATEHKCNDLDYLRFKISQNEDFDFEKDGKEFMEQFAKDAPQYFNAEIKGGGGGSNPTPGGNPPVDKFSELEKKENISLGEFAEGLASLNNNKNNE